MKNKAGLLKGVLKYGIGFGLLAYILYANWEPKGPDGVGLKDILAHPRFGPLGLAALLVAFAVSLQFVRWFVLVRALDLPFTLRNAFRLGMVGYFYNTVLPGAVGGDVLKGYFIAKEQPTRRAAAVATVVIDRAMGLFGLILFAAVVGSAAWALGDERIAGNPALQTMVQATAVIAGTAVAVYLLLGVLSQARADALAGWFQNLRFKKVGHALAEVWYAVWVYRQRPKVVVLGVAITAVCHVAMVGSFHFASHGFTPTREAHPASASEHAVICPLGFIAQAIPVSPGGVGVGEAVFGKLYEWSGRTPQIGTASRLALRLVEVSLGLLGYLVFLRMKEELPIEAMDEGADDFDVPPPSAEGGADAREIEGVTR